ncbi:MAG: recombination mediator RecR [Patescibacteria group bacterium]
MNAVPKPVKNLISAFSRLPGIGPKTAKRLTFYLLHVPREEVDQLAKSVYHLRRKTVLCEVCFNVTTESPCDICKANDRDRSKICVVEDPLDLIAIENTGSYRGLYHVLHGVISPVNHIGPEDLRLRELLDRLRDLDIEELVLATNPSMEGEATARYIKRNLPKKINKITRIAQGLPIGGELEYADKGTLSRALDGRTSWE